MKKCLHSFSLSRFPQSIEQARYCICNQFYFAFKKCVNMHALKSHAAARLLLLFFHLNPNNCHTLKFTCINAGNQCDELFTKTQNQSILTDDVFHNIDLFFNSILVQYFVWNMFSFFLSLSRSLAHPSVVLPLFWPFICVSIVILYIVKSERISFSKMKKKKKTKNKIAV